MIVRMATAWFVKDGETIRVCFECARLVRQVLGLLTVKMPAPHRISCEMCTHWRSVRQLGR